MRQGRCFVVQENSLRKVNSLLEQLFIFPCWRSIENVLFASLLLQNVYFERVTIFCEKKCFFNVQKKETEEVRKILLQI